LSVSCTPEDVCVYVIVAPRVGKVSEVFYGPSIGVHVAQLTTVSGMVGISGFYTPDDGYRHVIVATSDGKVSEVFYGPSIGVHVAQLTAHSCILGITGFYTPSSA